MLPFNAVFTKLRKSLPLAIFIIAASFGYLHADAQNCFINPRIKKVTANVSATIKSYMEFKPVDWNASSTKKHPLIVYIGGTGEMFQQPGGTNNDLCPVLNYSLPWRMNVGHFPDYVTDPATGTQYSYLVVMPFVTAWEQQYSIDPGAMIDYALQAYPNKIDLNRIYLTGMSRGTDNIMGYVTASAANANRIAAVVPTANCFPANVGTPGYTTQVNNMASGNIRLWGISCQGDKPCPETYIQNWVNSLNIAKPGNARFTYATMACDSEGPNASFHYAWNEGYDPSYRPAPVNKNVYEWMIQYSKGGANPPPPPPPVTPNCSTIVATPGTNSMKIKGLLAPVVTVQIFNSSWATVHNQVYNNPDSINVASLANGTYNVKVNFYNTNWTHICEKMLTVVIGGAPPPPPPPPPPTGTPNCSTIVASPITGGIKLKGLISPVVVVQVFNNSWATVFSRTYTNSPDSVNITPLANGVYHVKVGFNNASWAPICEKMVDVTVGGATPGAEIDTRSATVPQAVADPTDIQVTDIPRHMTVAPNPFRSSLVVTVGSSRTQHASITIIDLTGRQLFTRSVTLQRGVNRFTFIEPGSYRPGNYLIRLTTTDGVENLRVIKQ